MKKTIFILSLLLVSVLFSCSKEDGAYRPTPSDFSVIATPVTVVAEGGIVELTIKAGNLGWSIVSDQLWATPSAKFGSGDGVVKLTITKNETGAKRTTNVVVKPTFDVEPVTIAITQN